MDNSTKKDEVAEKQEVEVEEVDRTGDLEDEEIETAVEEDEEEEDMSDGQVLYVLLQKRDLLIAELDWDDLSHVVREKWEKVAEDLTISDIRGDIISEVTKK